MVQAAFQAVEGVIDKRLAQQSVLLESAEALVVVDPQVAVKRCPDVDLVEATMDRIEDARTFCDAQGIPVFIIYSAPGTGPHFSGLPAKGAHMEGEYRLYRQFLRGNFELCSKWTNSAFRGWVWNAEAGCEELRVHDRVQLTGALKYDYPHVKRLKLAGFNLGACVHDTALDAKALGYDVRILSDASENAYYHYMGDFDFYSEKQRNLIYLANHGIGHETLEDWQKARLTPPCAVRGSRPALPDSLTPTG